MLKRRKEHISVIVELKFAETTTKFSIILKLINILRMFIHLWGISDKSKFKRQNKNTHNAIKRTKHSNY